MIPNLAAIALSIIPVPSSNKTEGILIFAEIKLKRYDSINKRLKAIMSSLFDRYIFAFFIKYIRNMGHFMVVKLNSNLILM